MASGRKLGSVDTKPDMMVTNCDQKVSEEPSDYIESDEPSLEVTEHLDNESVTSKPVICEPSDQSEPGTPTPVQDDQATSEVVRPHDQESGLPLSDSYTGHIKQTQPHMRQMNQMATASNPVQGVQYVLMPVPVLSAQPNESELQKEVSLLRRECQENKRELAESIREKDEKSEKRFHQLEHELEEQRRSSVKFEKELSEAKREIEYLKGELKKKNEELALLNAKLEKAQQCMEEQTAELNEAKATVEKTQKELDEVKKEKEVIEEKLKEEEQLKEKKAAELNEANATVEETRKMLNEVNKVLDEKLKENEKIAAEQHDAMSWVEQNVKQQVEDFSRQLARIELGVQNLQPKKEEDSAPHGPPPETMYS